MTANQEDKKIEQGARFDQLITFLRLKQNVLAQLVGTKQPSISHAITGKTGIPKVWLYKLKQKYRNINEDWIWTGEGEMLMVSSNSIEGTTPMVAMDDSSHYTPGRPLKKDELERLVLRLMYRVNELESWKQDIEDRLKDK